jgi:hypothetical protein
MPWAVALHKPHVLQDFRSADLLGTDDRRLGF